MLEPEVVARRTVRAIQRNQREVIFPWQLALVTWLHRRLPVIGLRLLKAIGLFHPRLTGAGCRYGHFLERERLGAAAAVDTDGFHGHHPSREA